MRRILKSTQLLSSGALSGSAIWVYLGCHNELELHVTAALGAWRVLWTGEADWRYNCFNLLTRNILTLTKFLGKIKQLAKFLVKLVELSSYWAQKSDSERDEWLGGLRLICKGTFFIILIWWKFKILQQLCEVDRFSFVCIEEGFAGAVSPRCQFTR